jgi:hypothetical protein
MAPGAWALPLALLPGHIREAIHLMHLEEISCFLAVGRVFMLLVLCGVTQIALNDNLISYNYKPAPTVCAQNLIDRVKRQLM